MPKEVKKLYLSKKDKVLTGVCGGIAEYFEVDPTLVRLFFVFMAVFGGGGIILYIAALILMPRKN